MKLTRHTTAVAFLAEAQAALERQEALNNLMLGVALRLRDHPEWIKVPPYLATVGEGGVLLAAAVMTPPYRVIIHAESDDPAPLRLIAHDLEANGWAPPGTIGPAAVARALAEAWAATTGGSFRLLRHERVYELRRVIPPPPTPGVLRVATAADGELVAQWLYDFTCEVGMEDTIAGAAEIAAQRIDRRELFLWEDGRPVSLAGRGRYTTHGATIGPVYTPPAFRGRGYASACVAALSQQLLDAGRSFCALFTDLANPISNSIYQKIGYRPLGDFDEYEFTP
ncbi:MAG: GNAT family N-acetyltransferase [Anaerolineae bacterium]|nr:GNAT family N-acetyltransferase [Anaerolineae bacterium]